MSNIPYLSINLVALCSYIILFSAFFTAKKTPANTAFTFVLGGFTLWSGASILMRLQVYPGVHFWFYVSLLSLFASMLPLYFFMCSFAGVRNTRLKRFWALAIFAMLIPTALGLFLQPPAVRLLPTGQTVFQYSVRWPILIPCLFFLALFLSMAKILITMLKSRGPAPQGLAAVIFGVAAVVIGNFAQIIPGNTFPFDTLGGIVFALCLTYALIRRRLFYMEQLLSPSVFLTISMGTFLVVALCFVPALHQFLSAFTGGQSSRAIVLSAAVVALATALVYTVLHKLFFSIFSREERQSRALQLFSQSVAQTLSTEDIATQLATFLQQQLEGPAPLVLLEEAGRYISPGAPSVRESYPFTFTSSSACLRRFRSGESHLFTDHFTASRHYRLDDQAEFFFLSSHNIELVLPLKTGSEIAGLVLLPAKEHKRYTPAELELALTTASLVTIAIKNAVLYERIYREARMDHLTGLFSYNYFASRVNTLARPTVQEPLALIYLDVDDMKLYNQLYGTESGDTILKKIGTIIRLLTGTKGMAFRHSGKVFAILLPGFTADEALRLATDIQHQAARIATGNTKAVSISGGICTFPDVARDARQLTEYADIAVFNAKNSGKGKIEVFRSAVPASKQVADQVTHIISQAERKGFGYFSSYSATVLALTAAIDAKDHYTYAHSQNVAYYASVLAVAAGLTDSQVRLVYEASLLHDIGKISVPESILGKDSPLNPAEREIMNTHVTNSIEIIRHLPSMDYVVPVAVAHHERWDGQGYPRCIGGDDIPVAARCLTVADTFDAMTSDRPYRPGQSLEFALSELEAGSGTQFDPYIVRIFISLIHREEITVRSAVPDIQDLL